jgi:hypothetical protein
VTLPPVKTPAKKPSSTGKKSAPTAHQPLELTALAIAPGRFRAAGSGPTIARRSARRGATVSYVLTGSAAMKFELDRIVRGRLKNGTCGPAARRHRHARRACKLYKPLGGALRLSGVKGANQFRFSGRWAERRLKPGRYRLRALAAGAAGAKATAKPVTFRILRSHRKRAARQG